MTQEEIKAKLALTPEQEELVEKFRSVLKEMKEKKVGIILDYGLDSLSLTAFNDSEIIQIGNREDLTEDEDNIIDAESCLNWGNLASTDDYYTYDYYYSNLHVVFGDKTAVNQSMMSAAL